VPFATTSDPTPALPLGGRTTTVDRFRSWAPDPFSATIAIIGTAFAYGTASFFVRKLTDAGVASETVALARFAITALVLVRFVRLDRPHRRATAWGLGSGAAMALGWITFVQAVDRGSVASAGVVYMTYPLFAMLALAIMFDVRPSARQVAGGVLVVVGAAAALGPTGGVPWIAIAAPATFGLATAILTERLTNLDPFERLGAVAAGATIALLPLVLLRAPGSALPGAVDEGLWIVALGIGSALVPMLVYAAAAPRVGAARASVAGSIELPVVIGIGLVLGETVTAGHVIGTIAICVAVVVATATRPAHAIPGERRAG
jgi:drug/metabolite transporter (DMT)-like permease